MTDWIDYDTSNFIGTDEPVHAGITRKILQDNLTSAYENSGLDIFVPINKPIDGAHSTWNWIDFITSPIPVYGTQEAMHDYTIDLFYKMDTTGGSFSSISFRCYLLDQYYKISDDAVQTNEFSDSYIQDTSSDLEGSVSFTFTVQNTMSLDFNDYSYSMVFPLFARYITCTGDRIAFVKSIRIREDI